MGLFRCVSCVNPRTGLAGVEFDAGRPVCPTCSADGNLVVAMEVVHFDPPSGKPGRGLRRAACDEGLKVGRPNTMFSGEPGAVTCKTCKATPVWELNADLWGIPVVPPEHDRPADVAPRQ